MYSDCPEIEKDDLTLTEKKVEISVVYSPGSRIISKESESVEIRNFERKRENIVRRFCAPRRKFEELRPRANVLQGLQSEQSEDKSSPNSEDR